MRPSTYTLLLGTVLGLSSCSLPGGTWSTYYSQQRLHPRPSAPAESRAAPRSLTILEAPRLPVTTTVQVPHRVAALQRLERQVGRLSHPSALHVAFEAYWNFRSAHPEQVRNPYFYFVDYGLESDEPRGYVFDMDALTIVEGPFTVAHGRGSEEGMRGIPTRFTNIMDSAASSLGLYLTQETYRFVGTSAGRRYHSIGLRLHGVSGSFNSAARKRGIVVHGAPYVTPTKAGRSEGCPAMEMDRAERLIPLIANGGLVFLFSPRDASWMRNDPWVSGTGSRLAAAE
ncbi:MAG TPA: murein L,D-transpeptidase catalytic domain family protein [Longimicrobiaceae bacterium]